MTRPLSKRTGAFAVSKLSGREVALGPRSAIFKRHTWRAENAGHRNPSTENTKTRLAAGFCV